MIAILEVKTWLRQDFDMMTFHLLPFTFGVHHGA
jgi:hypothetical protein